MIGTYSPARRIVRLLLGVGLVAAGLAAVAAIPREGPAAAEAGLRIVPRPARLEAKAGDDFDLSPRTGIAVPAGQDEALAAARLLSEGLKLRTGLELNVATALDLPSPAETDPQAILLTLDESLSRLGEEGYLLDAGAGGAILRAFRPAGLFYGVQTMLQLPDRSFSIPGAAIEDRPRFAWRGALLDCSRHFFPKDFIKRWIDILAFHKLNVFHWHLTDDQGWRIEIRKHPRLTELGAWRVDREDKHWNAREPQGPGEQAAYGGFYTQDDIREIVAYAQSRFVTIVPEIEMPGHAKAALAAYPRLSCTGGPFTVPPGGYWPITDVFCPGRDETFAFLEDVLDEVIDLFPGTFIHIGGDEVDKAEWRRCPRCQARIAAEGLAGVEELQSWFVKRIEAHINGRGRRLIGWDEILEGGLAPRATVMSWRGTEGGIAAARAGHDVVMSPTSHCYLDYYQGDPGREPLAIGGDLPLSKVYSFEPVPDSLTPEEARHVLGGQGNLWTEYVPDGRHAEYMAMPRLAALAEALWSPAAARDWPDFARRLEAQFGRYEEAGFRAARSAFEVRAAAVSDPGRRRIVATLAAELPQVRIRYTTDGTEPGPRSKAFDRPLTVKATIRVRAAGFLGEERVSPSGTDETFHIHRAMGRLPNLTRPAGKKYGGPGGAMLVDGLLGSRDHRDGRWLGFEGEDLEAVIDIGRARKLRTVSTRFLQNINAWILYPARVEIAVSTDGAAYEVIGGGAGDDSARAAEVAVREITADPGGRKVRFVRVRAAGAGPLPDWHYGAGGKSWLFVDEIVVD